MNNTALSWCTNLHSAPSPSLLKPTPLPTLLIIIAQFLIIDSTGHFEAERESRMGWRRVELHCGSVWGHCCEGNWVKIPPSKRSSGGSRGGPSPPLIFRPNWGPKSRKKNWGDAPPLSQHGRMVSASHSKSGGPRFESRSGDLEDLFSVVPSSDHRPRL